MDRSTITLIILILVFLGILFFLTMPTYRKMSLAQGEFTQQSQVLEDTQNLVAVLSQLSEQFSSITTDIQKVKIAIPQKDDIAILLVEIPTLAAQNGLIVSEINFGEQIQNDGYVAIPIGLSARGSYLNLKSFLRSVEQNLRILDLASLTFSGDLRGGQYDFQFTIHTYAQ